MTVSSSLNRMPLYAGNGSTTAFAYTFPILADTDLVVALVTSAGAETAQSLGVDYSITSSCYDPAPNGAPCEKCDSCQLRAKGFAEANADDPLKLKFNNV